MVKIVTVSLDWPSRSFKFTASLKTGKVLVRRTLRRSQVLPARKIMPAACCSAVFTGANRIVGRVTASQMVSAPIFRPDRCQQLADDKKAPRHTIQALSIRTTRVPRACRASAINVARACSPAYWAAAINRISSRRLANATPHRQEVAAKSRMECAERAREHSCGKSKEARWAERARQK
ncbi:MULTISPECIES: hypothetical protein [Bradyrhizobium]|uniref:hypothetical protein n=1 Tax=Bradyrhizobium centrosematis TaxID=1300039 RepID=UPI00216A0D95|nr:hypothetical protein [Bradyrhizobium centrosematis]MCS3765939.1 hypothetical protein [Bradyrhizobium centrosematis]MCS3778345.1 hypothetical protein [Bradyrhizobium centrosematis]